MHINTTFENAPLNDIQRLVYYIGERNTQIILSQMRVHFCDLNSRLFYQFCVESSMCSCGVEIESLFQFFFNSCTNYNAQRKKFSQNSMLLLAIISRLTFYSGVLLRRSR